MSGLPPEPIPTPVVAVSACLLGRPVRHDGSHRRNELLLKEVGASCSLLPFCPEVDMGMGVPRETIRIELQSDGSRKLLGNRTGTDFTPRLHQLLEHELDRLEQAGVVGFLVKARSPSCAPDGMFTSALKRRFPELPILDEEALLDPSKRLRFIAEVFAAHNRTLLEPLS